jgi:hypothetical protein
MGGRSTGVSSNTIFELEEFFFMLTPFYFPSPSKSLHVCREPSCPLCMLPSPSDPRPSLVLTPDSPDVPPSQKAAIHPTLNHRPPPTLCLQQISPDHFIIHTHRPRLIDHETHKSKFTDDATIMTCYERFASGVHFPQVCDSLDIRRQLTTFPEPTPPLPR